MEFLASGHEGSLKSLSCSEYIIGFHHPYNIAMILF